MCVEQKWTLQIFRLNLGGVRPTFGGPKWSFFLKSVKSVKKVLKNGSIFIRIFLGIFHFLVQHKDFTFSKKFADKTGGLKKRPYFWAKSGPKKARKPDKKSLFTVKIRVKITDCTTIDTFLQKNTKVSPEQKWFF